MQHFFKYHSLGNDFIIFDLRGQSWYDPHPSRIQALCSRHTGIGADGILFITQNSDSKIHLTIFNADASPGQVCLNGLRCVALHLFTHHTFPAEFTIHMAGRDFTCRVTAKPSQQSIIIQTIIPISTYHGLETQRLSTQTVQGHLVDVGNPHFVITQTTTPHAAALHGAELQTRFAQYPSGINVEWVWQKGSSRFAMTVFERGVGMTQACSSGAVAVLRTLFELRAIDQSPIELCMQGGVLTGHIDGQGSVLLEGSATLVFEGKLT